jgi:hypothetical protein
LLFSFALEYTIKKIEENLDYLEFNVTHQLLICADNVNLLGESIINISKIPDILSHARKDLGTDISSPKCRSDHNMKSGNKTFKK